MYDNLYLKYNNNTQYKTTQTHKQSIILYDLKKTFKYTSSIKSYLTINNIL